MSKHTKFLKELNKTDKEMTELYETMSQTDFVANVFYEKIQDWHDLDEGSLKFLVDRYTIQKADNQLNKANIEFFLKCFDKDIEVSQKILKYLVLHCSEQRKYDSKNKDNLLVIVKLNERYFLFTWVNFLQILPFQGFNAPSYIDNIQEIDKVSDEFSKSAYKIRKK